MSAKKLNCWEYVRCGREPGGKKEIELGSCPAATDTSFDEMNSGNNAGRVCWAVAGTCCNGEIHRTYAQKRTSCVGCKFYKLVQEEEGTSKESHDLIELFSSSFRYLKQFSRSLLSILQNIRSAFDPTLKGAIYYETQVSGLF